MQAPFFANTIRDSAAGALFRRIATDYSWWASSHSSPQRFLEPSAAGRIAEIQVPTLILTAVYDIPACLEIADLLDESVPDSRKVVMSDTGHLMHMEKPDEFNQYLVAFVRNVGDR
jgi:pimeloyl-ACP methyl ester carboxylesterase